MASEKTDKNRQIAGGSGPSFPGMPAPIHDREDYERGMAALPPEQRELTEELTRYADTCQYFEAQRMDVPPHLLRAVAELSALPASEAAATMRQINDALMEYLHSVSDDPKLRM